MATWTNQQWLDFYSISERMHAAFVRRNGLHQDSIKSAELRDAVADALVACAEMAIRNPPDDPEAYLVAAVSRELWRAMKDTRRMKSALDGIADDLLIGRHNSEPIYRDVSPERDEMPDLIQHCRDDQERQILAWLQAGHSQAKIATKLGVHASTISRKIARIRARLIAS
jgi:DNA-directed RNA polymerase specialized sigma24 family protein